MACKHYFRFEKLNNTKILQLCLMVLSQKGIFFHNSKNDAALQPRFYIFFQLSSRLGKKQEKKAKLKYFVNR